MQTVTLLAFAAFLFVLLGAATMGALELLWRAYSWLEGRRSTTE